MDLLMWVSLLLALLSANSRLLMSFRRALYLLICSLMTSSTHLGKERAGQHREQEDLVLLHYNNTWQHYFVFIAKFHLRSSNNEDKTNILMNEALAVQRGRTYAVVLPMSCTLSSGSMVSWQRRMQGAKTMARALADILLVSSCRAILRYGEGGRSIALKRTSNLVRVIGHTFTRLLRLSVSEGMKKKIR